MRTNRIASGMSALALALGLAACGVEEPQVGVVEVALVSTGSDGALYRLPAQTLLYLQNGSYGDLFSLDGEASTVAISAPIGTYAASILHPNQYTTAWPLERVVGGVSEVVMGTLETPMPAEITLTEGPPAALLLSFRIANGGTVTFARGDLWVSLDVEEVTATGGASLSTFGTFVTQGIQLGSGPPELADLMPSVGDDVAVGLVGHVLPAWVQVSNQTVCTTIEIHSLSHDGTQGFIDLIIESLAPTGTLCVSHAMLTIELRRFGAPTTPTFQSLGSDFGFTTFLGTQLDVIGFDGETLDLDALAGTRTGQSFVITQLTHLSPAGFDTWFIGDFAGPATLTLVFVE